MNIGKFIPVGVRCFQILREFKRTRSFQVLTQKNIYRGLNLNIRLAFGLAVFWPGKKSDSKNEIKLEQTSSILETADNLFDNGYYEECYKLLKDAKADGNDVEIQWRICRALYNMSKDSKSDATNKRNLIIQAYELISKELQNHYNHFAVQKWYAILLDARSAQEGVRERIKQLENVKKHMDLAVTINPKDATTLYMLGEWCYQVADMPWHQRKIAEVLFGTPPSSSYEDALEYYLRAEAAQPRFYSLNLLRLGTCYMKLKKEDQAKYYLNLAVSYPAKSNDDHQATREAAELLKRLQ